jgi:trans-feruloyl-CoA hydratase/vanillin synthase
MASKTEKFGEWKNVLVDIETEAGAKAGIAWVTLNRPEKRNAMSPGLNDDMVDVLNKIEVEEGVGCVVITGAGTAFTAGMDLREYFRALDHLPYNAQIAGRRSAWNWQWKMLMMYAKPTIAMVNGWCFGGGFTPLVGCDLAIAADEATFGLSEINWGIIPGGNVTRSVVAVMNQRDAMYYIMTGKTFDGKKAAQMGLVNESVPLAELRDHTRELAKELLGKNPAVLRAAKQAVRMTIGMSFEAADEYLMAKSQSARFLDTEGGRQAGLKQFLDEKSFRPGLGNYKRDA